MSGMVHIVKRMGYFKIAHSSHAQPDERQWIREGQRYVFGDFIFTFVPIEVTCLHPLDVVKQQIGTLQSLLQAVPVSEPDERIVVAQLETIRTLGLLGEVVAKFVGAEI